MPLLPPDDTDYGLKPIGLADRPPVTRDEWSPPIREHAPLTSDLQGQESSYVGRSEIGVDTPLGRASLTYSNIWPAAFRRENEVVAVARKLREQRDFGDADPNHNPLDVIQGTPVEAYRDLFLTSKNMQETISIRDRIEREIADTKLLDSAGWAGFGAQAVASILSPTTFLPFGAVSKGYRAGRAAVATGGRTAAWAGAGVAAQEAALQSAQDTRTFAESLMSVGGGVVLGGLLGAGASAYGSRALRKASQAIDSDIAMARKLRQDAEAPAAKAADDVPFGRPDMDRAGGNLAGEAGDAGAAATRVVQENKLAKAFGIENLFEWSNPLSRMIGSESRAARDAATRMAEVPQLLEQNKAGIPTGPLGGSVESRIKVDGDLALYRFQEELHQAFRDYRFGDEHKRFAQTRAMLEGSAEKLSFKQFKAEVTKALRMEGARSENPAGYVHPIPSVQRVADHVRNDVFNLFKKQAQELKLLPEDAELMMGYVMRRYDVAKIMTDYDKFTGILLDWLKKGQARAGRELDELEAKLAAKQADVGKHAPELKELRRQIAEVKKAFAVDASEVDTHIGFWDFVVRGKPKKPETLAEWVKRSGGLKDDGKIIAHMMGSRKEAGRLIDNVRGANLDDMTLRAWEEGFFGTRPERPTINQFLDLLDDDVRAGGVVRERDIDALGDFAHAEEARNLLEESGALSTTSEKKARYLITEWLREQSAVERMARADLETDRMRLRDLNAELARTTDENAREMLADEIAKIKSQIGDVQAALGGFAEARAAKAPRVPVEDFEATYAGHGSVTVPSEIVESGLRELRQIAGANMESHRVGMLASASGRNDGSDVVDLVFIDLDGSPVALSTNREMLNSRALFSPQDGGFVGFIRRDAVRHGDQRLRGEYRHEAVHFLRGNGIIDDGDLSSLARHSDSLGVFDGGFRDYLSMVGDADAARAASGVKLSEVYGRLYHNRPDLAEVMTQEKVAHMVELAEHGHFTAEQLAPVKDVLDKYRLLGLPDGAERTGNGPIFGPMTAASSGQRLVPAGTYPDQAGFMRRLNLMGLKFGPSYVDQGVPIAKVSSLEDPATLESARVADYVTRGPHKPGDPNDMIWLYRDGGEYYIADGHHRVEAARQRGDETVTARVRDVVPRTDGVAAVSGRALDISPEARKARAEDQGFDTTKVWYHGTSHEFDAFDEDNVGHWFSDTKDYAKWAGGRNARVVEAYLRVKNPYVFDVAAEGDRIAKELGTELPKSSREAMEYISGSAGWNVVVEQIANKAKRQGHDGVFFENFEDRPGGGNRSAMYIFDSHNIRDTQAVFDKAESGSSNLMAAVGSPKLSDADAKLLDELRGLEPTLKGEELGTIRRQIAELEAKAAGQGANAGSKADARIPTPVLDTVERLAKELGIEAPALAGKTFDEGVEILEKFTVQAEAAASRLGRASTEDVQKMLSKIDELKFFATADAQELAAIVSDTTAKITGSPAGLGINPFDPMFAEGKTGALKGRTLKIPDLYVSDKGHAFADFLDDDIERISTAYVRGMAPDIAITREFGDLNLTSDLRRIQEEADRRAKANPERSSEILKKAAKDQKDLQAMAARLRGRYNVNQDPMSWGPWTARRVKEANVLRLMGSVVAASIADPAKLVVSHGFRQNAQLFATLVSDLKGARLSMAQAKEMSAGLELVMSRSGVMWDAFDDFGGHSKFDQAMQTAVNKFGRLTLMDQWNATLKQLSGAMTVNRILRASVDLADGKIKEKQLTKLAKSGIGRETAVAIAEQYKKHGGMHGRLWLANADEWDDAAKSAKQAMHAAVRREADITVVTPGQEKPLWLSSHMGSVIGQFRTFQMSTIQRTLIPAIQEADAAVIVGLSGMLGLGILSERLKMLIHGKEEKDGPKHTGDWLYAGLANSGILGWITDVDQTLHKASRGKVSAANLIFQSSRPISRFASQNVTGSFLGPSFGAAQDVVTAFGGASSGDVNRSDMRAMRRLLPYQNLFWISRTLRAGEDSLMDSMGLPEASRRN